MLILGLPAKLKASTTGHLLRWPFNSFASFKLAELLLLLLELELSLSLSLSLSLLLALSRGTSLGTTIRVEQGWKIGDYVVILWGEHLF